MTASTDRAPEPQALKLELNDSLMGEALRYLGYRSASVVDDTTRKDLESAFSRLIAAAGPKYTYQLCERFETKAPSQLILDRFKIQSLALHNHLAPYTHVVMMAATLGTAVDKLIDREMLLSPVQGLLLNAAASALIEEVCDHAENEALEAIAHRLGASRSDLSTCFRFSPGYGDLELAVNGVIISALSAEKRIGVTTSRSHLLVPRKSVTAIFGLKVGDATKTTLAADSSTVSNMGCKRGNCNTCSIQDNCPYK